MLLASSPRLFARRFLAFCAALVVSVTVAFAQFPSAADGFDPNVDGTVFTLLTQSDGKILVGGQFSSVRGFPRNNIARLNVDGSLDDSFNPNANGPVRAMVLQADGRIIIGGDFTTLQPGASVVNRGRIARLNTDGTVEAAFNPNLGGDLQPQVFALALQANGQIVAGGSFTTSGSTTRNHLARFNADGTLDAAFNPNPNAMVLALALHVDNKIVVGGAFTSFQATGDAGVTQRNRIARLNPNGTVDSEFNPNANNGVTTLAVQRDGKIVLGGFFTTLQPIGDESPASRIHIGRLNVNGTLDSEFFPRVEGNVAAVVVQPDGGILVGGAFSSVWGRGASASNRSNVARFNPDGSLDEDFAPVLNAAVNAFAAQADGKVIVGGNFTRALPLGSTTALVRNHVARLNADGSIDANFELDAGGRILASVTQTDGKIVIGGTFTNVGGATHNYLARLNADGTVDSTYNPDFNGRVYSLAYEASSNKVIVGGAFTTVGGETRNHIARLNPSGTIDSEFYPSIDGQVGVVVLQSDGRILVGGSFTSVQAVGATTTTARSNILRLNANGSLDTGFDPSANSSISAIAVQPDGKVLLGGLFSALSPGFAANTSAPITSRSFFARVNADGTLDTAFAPNPNGQISTIAVQTDGKIVIGGAFTGLAPVGATELTERNRIARLNADGSIDTAYNPNANGNVLAAALQSDGKLLIGGSFTTLQPGTESVFTLRKYAARLNADGTVDSAFNLDINELPGNRVDSIRVQPDGRFFLGGSFTSLHPAGTAARVTRSTFARLAANGSVDTTFEASAGGSTGAIVNGFAIQPDGKVIAVGSFGDLGGAKSTNIARFLPEGSVDTGFSTSIAADGPVNAVAVRPNGAPVSTQTAGFAWLNPNGTLRAGFSTATRLSGEINAIAVQGDGQLLLGGSFANLSNTTGGNLVRFNANGAIDPSFNPAPNGAVTGIAIQADGRIIIVGSFTVVGGVARNRIARIDANGSLDVTFDPNASARINSVVIQADGQIVIGGAFTTLTPNATATSVTRNYLARISGDGNVDANYNPNPNFNVNSVALQSDGKVIAGGAFTAVQPNSGVDSFARNAIARFNTDGTLDQNFNPNGNAAVNAIVVLANGQMVIGGAFTTLQPNGSGTVFTRNNIARINSDGAVDASFNPNANGNVSTLSLQPDGAVLVGGSFTALQPGATGAIVARQSLARVNADGSLDLNFNPDVNGAVAALGARPDGSVLVGGSFNAVQLNGSILVGGNFGAIGGVPARNLASLNDGGSVNTTFQPRPDGAVNAILTFPDGKVIVGGAFTSIAGAARNRLARFNADGSLDTAFNPNASGVVSSLAMQTDGKIIVGGAFTTIGGQERPRFARLNTDGSVDASFAPTNDGLAALVIRAIAVQAGGQIVAIGEGPDGRHSIGRVLANGSPDASFTSSGSGTGVFTGLALQADGRILVSGSFTSLGGTAISRVVRLNSNGTVDTSFNPAPNAAVTAVALQSDGRVVLGGSFTNLSGQQRVGIARLGATSAATQVLGVAANRTAIMWNRSGTTGEVAAVIFEISSDRVSWTRLGEGTRTGTGSDWQLTGVNLPASGVFYIRARGLAPTTAGTSSGIFETIREFNFASPVGGSGATIAQAITPAQAASPLLALDPLTGIAARSTIMMVPGEGSVEIIATTNAATTVARLANLSTRGRVTTENPLILGFAIAGTESRPVLVRAVGPALRTFGVTDALAATRLDVYDDTGKVIAMNEGWAGAANLIQAAAATGAFPLTPESADSAAVLTLAPGNYTIQVVDSRGSGGVALAEIYDAGSGAGSRLVNVSSRGAAGTGSAAMISGFVIAGSNTAERLLLRGVGPGLTKFGATGVVADPSVALYDAEGRSLGMNDNWVSSLSAIANAALSAGAFALDAGSRDAAVLATLPNGAYTIQVSAGTTGTALLEIYEVR
jgi:uncharacterized delta-60 repeat protein